MLVYKKKKSSHKLRCCNRHSWKHLVKPWRQRTDFLRSSVSFPESFYQNGKILPDFYSNSLLPQLSHTNSSMSNDTLLCPAGLMYCSCHRRLCPFYTLTSTEPIYNHQIWAPVIRLHPDGKTELAGLSRNCNAFIERFLCGKCEITRDTEASQRQNRDNAAVRG